MTSRLQIWVLGGCGSPGCRSCSVLSRNLGQLFQEGDGKATKGCLDVIAHRRACGTAHVTRRCRWYPRVVCWTWSSPCQIAYQRLGCFAAVQRRSTDNWSHWRHLFCNLTDVWILRSFYAPETDQIHHLTVIYEDLDQVQAWLCVTADAHRSRTHLQPLSSWGSLMEILNDWDVNASLNK